jgi:AraC family transcriptional regulator, regulatory protein of adaptative response / methylated-DNA-[protein]-cysteine methyltransferase
VKDTELLELARYIDANADQRLSLAELAARIEASPTQLQKRFKALFGVSPKAYQDAARLTLMKQALRRGEPVTDAIFSAGFGSTSRAYAPARELGMVPKRYAQGGACESISHASVLTPLGWLMMAATDRGVCFVQFGESGDELLQNLRAEFPRAELAEASPSAELHDWLHALLAHLQRSGPSPKLPLDLRGTAFQIAVWRFLMGLERGATVSYSELATAVGRPKAVRAAASACARNRIAVLVPCHRVLRADGGMGGYRWGVERKVHLLAAESDNSQSPPEHRAGFGGKGENQGENQDTHDSDS